MRKRKIEHGTYRLCARVFNILSDKPQTIEQLTKEIYTVASSENVYRVYRCIMAMLNEGVAVPQFRNGLLYFRFNNGVKSVDKKENGL